MCGRPPTRGFDQVTVTVTGRGDHVVEARREIGHDMVLEGTGTVVDTTGG